MEQKTRNMFSRIIFFVQSAFFSHVGKQLLFKNATWLITSEIIGRFLKFLFFIYLAREFGPDSFGAFSFALAFVGIAVVFADFGISTIATRNLSRGYEMLAQFRVLLGLKVTLLLVVFVIMAVAGFFTSSNSMIFTSILLLGIYTFAASFIDVLSAYFRSLEKMEYEASFQLLHTVLAISAAYAFVHVSSDILHASAGYALGGLIALVIAVLVFIHQAPILEGVMVSMRVWKSIMREAWPLALVALAAVIYNQIDQIMLGIMRTDAEVGLYNAAFRITLILSLPVAVIIRTVFPRLSRVYMQGFVQARNVWKKLFFSVAGVAALISGVAYMSSDTIIMIVYGSDFSDASCILQILVIATAINALCLTFNFFYVAVEKQIVVLFVTAVTAVLNIALNMLVIPEYGMFGAAFATLVSMVVMLVLYSGNLVLRKSQ